MFHDEILWQEHREVLGQGRKIIQFVVIGLPDSRIAENTEKIANLSFLMQVYAKGFSCIHVPFRWEQDRKCRKREAARKRNSWK